MIYMFCLYHFSLKCIINKNYLPTDAPLTRICLCLFKQSIIVVRQFYIENCLLFSETGLWHTENYLKGVIGSISMTLYNVATRQFMNLRMSFVWGIHRKYVQVVEYSVDELDVDNFPFVENY